MTVPETTGPLVGWTISIIHILGGFSGRPERGFLRGLVNSLPRYLHWRGDEFDLDIVLLCPLLSHVYTLKEALLDCVDSLVCEAGDLNVSPDLDGLGGQAALDVLEEVRLDLLGHLDFREGVLGALSRLEGQLESVVGVAVLLVQRPADLGVEVLEIELPLVREVSEARASGGEERSNERKVTFVS